MMLSFLEAVRMRSLRLALFVFLISVVPMLAQTSTTSVRGTITDPSGALVPGAQISLTNTADNSVTNGTSARTLVPRPGDDSMLSVPPTISTRSLIPSKPSRL